MAREQVDPLRQPSLNPVASPVNRFERTDAGQQLGQLADALKGLSPELAQFSGTMATQIRSRDTEEGRRHADKLFAEVQQTGRAIKAGEIAPSQSKWFRAAAEEQLGRLHAGRFASEMTLAMSDPNGELSQSTDPADFDRVVGERRQQYLANLGEQGGSFNSAFTAISNDQINSARNQFAAQAGQRLETQVIEATYQEHQQMLEDGFRKGLTVEQIGAMIYERNTIQYALNPKSGAALSNTMLRAVIDTARKTENLEILEVLKHIPGGAKGSMLANTSQANKLVPEAIREIRAARQQRYALDNTEDRNERKEQLEVALEAVYGTMDTTDKNGQTLTPEQLQGLANSVNPEDRARVYRAFDSLKKRTEVDDEAVKADLFNRAFRGSLTYEEVADAFESDDLTVETSRKLRQEIRNNRQKRGAAKALTQQPQLQETKGRLRGLFIDQYGINAPEMRMRAELSVQDLENAWVEWRRTDGVKADDAQISEWLHAQTMNIFAKRANLDLKESTAEVTPSTTVRRPAPVDWKKGRVVKQAALTGLQLHLDNMARIPNYKLPPAYEDVLVRNGIGTYDEAVAFVALQRTFPE